MFTGIVEESGSVRAVERLDDGAARLVIHGPTVTADAHPGDSIAVNGVCLTVVDSDAGQFSADVMAETLRRTSLGSLSVGAPVNLERPVQLQSRLGGHLVQGHVDGTGIVRARQTSENWDVVRIGLPTELARYVVEKGSITVDGVSLTVSAVGADPGQGWFEVSLIPTTRELTTIGRAAIGSVVNLEVDIVAKYVERLMSWQSAAATAAGHRKGEDTDNGDIARGEDA